jgi:hypothetical protein
VLLHLFCADLWIIADLYSRRNNVFLENTRTLQLCIIAKDETGNLAALVVSMGKSSRVPVSLHAD